MYLYFILLYVYLQFMVNDCILCDKRISGNKDKNVKMSVTLA